MSTLNSKNIICKKKIAYIPVITLLRGLAALMVCLYHFICKTTDYITDEITLNIFHFGELGVSMFFYDFWYCVTFIHDK